MYFLVNRFFCSSECITEPTTCKAGFQLGVQLSLGYYNPGEGADTIGSILLLGSPDVRKYLLYLLYTEQLISIIINKPLNSSSPSVCLQPFFYQVFIVYFLPKVSRQSYYHYFSTGFEGLALQLFRVDSVHKMTVLVANNEYTWNNTIVVQIDVWFDLLIGWNTDDGIVIKINNVVQKGLVSETVYLILVQLFYQSESTAYRMLYAVFIPCFLLCLVEIQS